jgi:Oxygen-sensitive ribonucleoside-triphosphate reductase
MSDREFIKDFSHEKKEEVVLGQKNYKIKKVTKRDGRIVDFDPERIKYAVERAMKAVGQYDKEKLEKVVDYIIRVLEEKYDDAKYPTVEEIQDIVELSLLKFDLYDVAKAYISYRKKKKK